MFAGWMPPKVRLPFSALFYLLLVNPLWAQQEIDRSASETITIRSIRDIHAFQGSPGGLPFEIEGIIAYFDANWPIFFFTDGDRGMYVSPRSDVELKTGDKVILRGKVSPHRYLYYESHELVDSKIEFPPALSVKYQRLRKGEFDSQFVRQVGMAISYTEDHGHYAVTVAVDVHNRFDAYIHTSQIAEDELMSMLGKQLAVDGVVGAVVDKNNQFLNFRLWVPDWREHITVSEDPLHHRVNVESISRLSDGDRLRNGVQFYKVRGRLLKQIDAHIAAMADETGAIYLEFGESTSVPPEGSLVEAAGVLERGKLSNRLRHATARPVEGDAKPELQAAQVDPEELFSGAFDAQLIRTSGIVSQCDVRDSDLVMLLRAGPNLFNVIVQGSQDLIPVGATAQIEGVCVNRVSTGVARNAFTVFSGPESVKFTRGVSRWLYVLLYGAGGLTLLSIAWGASLRHQVRSQTEKLRLEFARREQTEAEHSRILETAKVGMVALSDNGVIESANAAFADATGIASDELIHLSISRLLSEAGLSKLKSAFKNEMGSTGSASLDLEMQRGDGALISYEVTLWRSSDDSRFQTMWKDISERKTLEQHRRKMESKMSQLQKQESLGVLAAGVAHDFSNLLTAILGNSSLAKAHLGNRDPRAVEYIDQIEHASQHASELTRQMLAYSGRGQFVVETVELPALINDCLKILAPSISKKAELCTRYQPNLPPMEADVSQLRQVVFNLVLNASESLEDSQGAITISIECYVWSPDQLKNYVLDQELPGGKYLLLTVSDSGCGMSESTLQRIFDPFFTTKFTGRGLGLASVLGIVRAHQGGISVNSKPGLGSSFEIVLPVIEDPHEVSLRTEFSEGNCNHPTIVVADDEPTIRASMVTTLSQAGFRVISCADGAEAVQAVETNLQDVALTLLDLKMPNMDGATACREILKLRSDMKVVFCSGYADSPLDSNLCPRDQSKFIQKPFTGAELLTTVRSLVESSDKKARR